jgi:hypothetical protein
MATLAPGEKSRMYALGGLARGGAFRGGYVDSRVYITIDGDHMGWGAETGGCILLDTLTISDILDEAPSVCDFRVHDSVPTAGAEVRITRGSQNGQLLFGGYALTVQEGYVGVPHHVQADVRAVDYTWLLGMHKVTGQYVNTSATAIVQDLVTRFAGANGFTVQAVAPGLPVLDVITFTNEDLPAAITRICRRIGASWYCDYDKSVHVFTGADPAQSPPEPITPSHKSLAAFTASRERTQALTRVLVEGRGSTLLAAVPAGETILPLEAVDMFVPAGDVFLKVSVAGADSTLHLNFAGVVASAGGTLIGPGIQPTAAPAVSAIVSATGMDLGVHSYAYTFVTASGETKPSPLATFDTAIPAPTWSPLLIQNPPQPSPPATYGSNFPIGSAFRFAVAYCYSAANDPAMDSPIGPPSVSITTISNNDPFSPAQSAEIRVGVLMPAPAGAPYVAVYVSTNTGPFYRWTSAANPSPGSAPYTHEVTTRGATNPTSGPMPPATVTARQATVAAIAVGPTGTTARKLYRTAANQATLKLLATLANNTATTYGPDAAADATLGATAPTGDTSGLQAPEGTVNPGVTTVPVAAPSLFNDSGGWAVTAEQALRYTGVSSTALTGIPAIGPGAVVGPIQYNTAIRSAPLLTGIPASGLRSLGVDLNAGDEVYAVVQVDDVPRQAQLAADLNLTDGVREEWIQDRRLSIPEARARGQATLAARPLTDETVEYTCRDTRTASGQTVHVDLPAPINVTGDYRIQQVTWSKFRPRAEQPPTARVVASNRRFSFEDWLRIIKTGT